MRINIIVGSCLLLLAGCTSASNSTQSVQQCKPIKNAGANTEHLDFQSNQLPPDGWKLQIPRTQSAQLFSDPTDLSNQVLRFELRPGEKVQTRSVNRPRAEIYEKYYAPFDTFIEYKFRVYIPSEWQNDDVRALIAQWHAYPDRQFNEVSRSPNLAIDYRDDKFLIRIQTSKQAVNYDNKIGMVRNALYKSEKVTKNQWHQFKVQVRWSAQDSGKLAVWLDNKKVINYTGPTAYNDCVGPYFKMGIYREESDKTFVIYHDDYERRLLRP